MARFYLVGCPGSVAQIESDIESNVIVYSQIAKVTEMHDGL